MSNYVEFKCYDTNGRLLQPVISVPRDQIGDDPTRLTMEITRKHKLWQAGFNKTGYNPTDNPNEKKMLDFNIPTPDAVREQLLMEGIVNEGDGDDEDDGDDGYAIWYTNPITYFCALGDLDMCSFLRSNGADTTGNVLAYARASTASGLTSYIFPMYIASLYGHLEVVKWLCNNGARDDIERRNPVSGHTPLTVALHLGHHDVYNWMLRQVQPIPISKE